MTSGVLGTSGRPTSGGGTSGGPPSGGGFPRLLGWHPHRAATATSNPHRHIRAPSTTVIHTSGCVPQKQSADQDAAPDSAGLSSPTGLPTANQVGGGRD